MKKQEIYVPIANKKEAKRAKAVLEAMGENIAPIFWSGEQKEHGGVSLKFNQDKVWIVSNVRYNVGEQTTLKQLIELLVSEQKQTEPEKIAVRVENEKEFNALMKYYDSLGWKWVSTHKPFDYTIENFYPKAIPYQDFFFYGTVEQIERNNYKIIPFSEFAKEHGIRVPLLVSEDGVELFEGDLFHEARAYNTTKDKWMYCHSDEWTMKKDSYVITRSETSKAFSTKKAALDWIEAHKPKVIEHTLYFGGIALFNQDKAEIEIGSIKLSFGDIHDLYSEIKRIQK